VDKMWTHVDKLSLLFEDIYFFRKTLETVA